MCSCLARKKEAALHIIKLHSYGQNNMNSGKIIKGMGNTFYSMYHSSHAYLWIGEHTECNYLAIIRHHVILKTLHYVSLNL